MVRLKGETSSDLGSAAVRFQFHSGSIKRVGAFVFAHPLMLGFNSIVVRLKERRSHPISRRSTKFQFHSGSIKSRIRRGQKRRSLPFQFHSGSIKRILEGGRRGEQVLFQFHSGSIKSGAVMRHRSLQRQVSIP